MKSGKPTWAWGCNLEQKLHDAVGVNSHWLQYSTGFNKLQLQYERISSPSAEMQEGKIGTKFQNFQFDLKGMPRE